LLEGFEDDEAALEVPTGRALEGARVAVKDGELWFRGTVGEYCSTGAHTVAFDFDGQVCVAGSTAYGSL
jgi:hypothetical protein